MKKNFFYIEGMKFKHLLRRGFWNIIYSGIIAYFGWNTIYGPLNDQQMSVGYNEPIPKLIEQGYTVDVDGWVFWQHIILYKLVDKA